VVVPVHDEESTLHANIDVLVAYLTPGAPAYRARTTPTIPTVTSRRINRLACPW